MWVLRGYKGQGAEYGSESVLGKRGASADRETVSTMSRKDRQVLGGEDK